MQVAQAFLRLIKGPDADLPLWFVSEMPKPETKLRLDFSSLLGPLFFMWVIQLLFPVSFCSIDNCLLFDQGYRGHLCEMITASHLYFYAQKETKEKKVKKEYSSFFKGR